MVKIINAPTKYVQGSDEIKNLATYYKFKGNKGAYIIVDKYIYDNFKCKISESFEKEGISYHLEIFNGECSQVEIDRNINILKEKNYDVVFGIGGGKTLDAAKAVSYYENVPIIIVPTIASTDAPCSALSVILYGCLASDAISIVTALLSLDCEDVHQDLFFSSTYMPTFPLSSIP